MSRPSLSAFLVGEKSLPRHRGRDFSPSHRTKKQNFAKKLYFFKIVCYNKHNLARAIFDFGQETGNVGRGIIILFYYGRIFLWLLLVML